MAVTDYIELAVTRTVSAGVLETVKRFYGYDDAVMNCVAATAAVQAMTEAQLLALATTAPIAPFQKKWRVTTCAGAPAGGTDIITNVVLGPTEPDEGTGTGAGGGAGELSNYTFMGIYE